MKWGSKIRENMAQTAQQTAETWKEKLDKVLHEKGAMTDMLEKAEQKTGIRRMYIVSGDCSEVLPKSRTKAAAWTNIGDVNFNWEEVRRGRWPAAIAATVQVKWRQRRWGGGGEYLVRR